MAKARKISKTDIRKMRFKNTPTFILDPGHGGIIDGEYQTDGKRSPIWDDGRQLFEGEFNRDIVKRVMFLCQTFGISCINLVDNEYDIPLRQRTIEANELYEDIANCILISIHANAGGGTGFEIFTSPGETRSDEYAEIAIKEFQKEFPELRLRADTSDGDHDKEARFWMVMQTECPAYLIECAFMDTLKPDCELLMSDEGRDRFAKAIFRGIKQICNENQPS